MFGRKRTARQAATNEAETALDDALTSIEQGDVPDYDDGPYDFVAETERRGFVYLRDHIDLGSLLVPQFDGTMSLALNEESGDIESMSFKHDGGELELIVFSNAGRAAMWPTVRSAIADDLATLGGTSEEQHGPFGPEVHCTVPSVADDGAPAVSAGRVVGFDGPGWFLQATFHDALAVPSEESAPYEEILRQVFVRGDPSVPPDAPLPLVTPG